MALQQLCFFKDLRVQAIDRERCRKGQGEKRDRRRSNSVNRVYAGKSPALR